jgi:hypothetical protein
MVEQFWKTEQAEEGWRKWKEKSDWPQAPEFSSMESTRQGIRL